MEALGPAAIFQLVQAVSPLVESNGSRIAFNASNSVSASRSKLTVSSPLDELDVLAIRSVEKCHPDTRSCRTPGANSQLDSVSLEMGDRRIQIRDLQSDMLKPLSRSARRTGGVSSRIFNEQPNSTEVQDNTRVAVYLRGRHDTGTKGIGIKPGGDFTRLGFDMQMVKLDCDHSKFTVLLS